ncbi:MAG: gentisate 1,2-dioxygenase [SAR324 cluster bacterium]|nr:gentisate 1,2-dioxygenase [SAR324 cluster bacterium]
MRAKATFSAERGAYYERISPLNLAPLWEVFHQLIDREPASPCIPAVWDYEAVRPHLLESGRLISAKEAERRVLVLENPALRGHSCITRTLYAGLQLVMPGEVAPCHRHSQSALRLIIEGSGAYTAVNGERIFMERGDFIITPSWTWHDHGNDTTEPVVWLDGLDIPLVKLMDASFIEGYPEEISPESRPPGDNRARYGANMKPIGAPASNGEPDGGLVSYPYAASREALERLRRAEGWDPHHGIKMEFLNPRDGGPAMPTISTFIQALPQGFATAPYRSTDGTIYTVIEGEGESVVGGTTLPWRERDVFVVPSWHTHHHRATQDSVLFSFSDRVVQQKLGLWREQKDGLE